MEVVDSKSKLTISVSIGTIRLAALDDEANQDC
jgi:hypothetical protein